MKNVEVKAKVNNVELLKEKASFLSGNAKEIIMQHDTFYNVPRGRLKLRKFEDGHAELIFYNRPDVEGPKLCSYQKCDISADNVNSLHNVLETALGFNGVVNKRRELYLVGQTRVHVDSVDGLGNFMELEVVMKPDQPLEEGQEIANTLLEKLGIDKDDLLSGAYRDLLHK